MNRQPWELPDWIDWTRLLLNSYAWYVGHELVPRTTSAQDSQSLFEAPFVVVAHGTEADPLLNYGNAAATKLWQTTLSQLIGMPSRKTAEPVHRDERARLLQRTRKFGFIDDYSGIRISTTGQRFRIHQATVWNVIDDQERHAGQAATFSEWTMLDAND